MAEKEDKEIIRLQPLSFRLLGLGLILLGVFFSLSSAKAASLYFSPSSGAYKIGDSLTLSVYVSADEPVNAISGDISFPADKLEATAVSTSGSIINFWVQNPSYQAGNVHFEGVVLSPGFTGKGGKVMSISLKTKAAGQASVSFLDASVLADDGQGTNVITSAGQATLTISLPQVGPSPEESSSLPDTTGAPPAVKISSPTHPEPSVWYNDSNPRFEWSLPNDVTDINVLVDKEANTNPGTVSDGRASHYNFKDVDDGEWYFHLRLKNKVGWGGVSHFKFQIDTAKPNKFEISPVASASEAQTTAKFLFIAEDSGSGIGHYEVSIDGGAAQTWQDDGSRIYETPALTAGVHSLSVKVLDKAGNFITSAASFEISALAAPEITSWPKKLSSKERLEIKGRTGYPNSRLNIWLQKDGGEPLSYEMTTDMSGDFLFSPEELLEAGSYTLWVEMNSESCPLSQASRKINFEVIPPKAVKAGLAAVSVMAVVVPLLALLIVLIFLLWYSWRKFQRLRHNIKREVRQEEAELFRSFSQLRLGLEKQVKLLEAAEIKRGLSQEEGKLLRQLKKLLRETE